MHKIINRDFLTYCNWVEGHVSVWGELVILRSGKLLIPFLEQDTNGFTSGREEYSPKLPELPNKGRTRISVVSLYPTT